MKTLYVLKRYPRLSETFIVRELVGVQALGVGLGIEALLPPEQEPRHEELSQVRAQVRYLPRSSGWRSDGLLAATCRVGLARPVPLLQELWRTWRSRPGDPRAGRRLRYAVLVADRARREGFTGLHAHFATGATQVAVPAARLAGLPVTVTAHAKDVFHEANATALPARVAGAAAVVTVSDYNARHLRQVLPAHRVVHIPNGVALGPVAPGVGRPEAPVLVVARLVPKKGVDTAIEAVARLAPDDPQLRLNVVGAGPLLESLRQLAQDRGVGDRVRFLGALPSAAVEAAYQRSGLVVLPCRIDPQGDRDGLPTVLVEALARGIPVVSTAVVGIPELVQHGRTGLLVQPDDIAGLAGAISSLRRDPAAAAQLGLAGRRLVAQAYDPAASAHALTTLWQQVAA